jgi:hypothetical protein
VYPFLNVGEILKKCIKRRGSFLKKSANTCRKKTVTYDSELSFCLLMLSNIANSPLSALSTCIEIKISYVYAFLYSIIFNFVLVDFFGDAGPNLSPNYSLIME